MRGLDGVVACEIAKESRKQRDVAVSDALKRYFDFQPYIRDKRPQRGQTRTDA